MRTSVTIPTRLIVIGIIVVALILGIALTPVASWVATGADNAWQAFLRLPGMVWARDQMASDERSTSGADVAQLNALLESGHELQQEEAYDAAEGKYRDALELDEEYAPAHVALAGLYMELEREGDAVEELEKAAALVPDNTFVLGQLGQLYIQRDEYEEAVDVLERAKALDPDEGAFHYWLGVTYQLRSFVDIESSVNELATATELEPDRAEIHYHLAMAYVRRDDDLDAERAIDALNRALTLDPALVDAYYYLGRLYADAGDSESARRAWQYYVDNSDDARTVERLRTLLQGLESGGR